MRSWCQPTRTRTAPLPPPPRRTSRAPVARRSDCRGRGYGALIAVRRRVAYAVERAVTLTGDFGNPARPNRATPIAPTRYRLTAKAYSITARAVRKAAAPARSARDVASVACDPLPCFCNPNIPRNKRFKDASVRDAVKFPQGLGRTYPGRESSRAVDPSQLRTPGRPRAADGARPPCLSGRSCRS